MYFCIVLLFCLGRTRLTNIEQKLALLLATTTVSGNYRIHICLGDKQRLFVLGCCDALLKMGTDVLFIWIRILESD